MKAVEPGPTAAAEPLIPLAAVRPAHTVGSEAALLLRQLKSDLTSGMSR